MERSALSAASPPIEAVTFDVGGTLIHPWHSVGDLYARVAARHGFPNIDPAALNRQFVAAWQAKTNFNHSRQDWQNLVRQTFQDQIGGSLGIEMFQDLYREFLKPESWRLFPDVRPTLERLKSRGLRLGVISNWDERLRPLLESLGLSAWFNPIIISVEAGQAKPSPGIFEQARAALNLPAHKILHIGDSMQEDVEGARAAGMQALLLDRRHGSRDAEILSSLDELPARLGI